MDLLKILNIDAEFKIKFTQQINDFKKDPTEDSKKLLNFSILTLKKLNRDIQLKCKEIKDNTVEFKSKVDKRYLVLQNLLYQLNYLKQEITNCTNSPFLYDELKLVAWESFSKSIMQEKDVDETLLCQIVLDENYLKLQHEVMIQRFNWEIKERIRLAKEIQVLSTKKNDLQNLYIKNYNTFESVYPSIKHILSSCEPLEKILNINVKKKRYIKEVLTNFPLQMSNLYNHLNESQYNLLVVNICKEDCNNWNDVIKFYLKVFKDIANKDYNISSSTDYFPNNKELINMDDLEEHKPDNVVDKIRSLFLFHSHYIKITVNDPKIGFDISLFVQYSHTLESALLIWDIPWNETIKLKFTTESLNDNLCHKLWNKSFWQFFADVVDNDEFTRSRYENLVINLLPLLASDDNNVLLNRSNVMLAYYLSNAMIGFPANLESLQALVTDETKFLDLLNRKFESRIRLFTSLCKLKLLSLHGDKLKNFVLPFENGGKDRENLQISSKLNVYPAFHVERFLSIQFSATFAKSQSTFVAEIVCFPYQLEWDFENKEIKENKSSRQIKVSHMYKSMKTDIKYAVTSNVGSQNSEYYSGVLKNLKDSTARTIQNWETENVLITGNENDILSSFITYLIAKVYGLVVSETEEKVKMEIET